MITARMVRTDDGRSYRVTFPYDPTVVDAIKRIVPAHSRRYDPAEKAWFIAPAYQDIIHQLLEDVFITVDTDHERSADPPPRSATPHTSYTVLHLQPTAPPELVEVAFKCLSKLYHPDRGGSHEQMIELNTAISTIRRQVS